MFQGSLYGTTDPAVDGGFTNATRIELADGAWVDHVPSWLTGADDLFATVADLVAWDSPMVGMWDKPVQTPRLSGSLAEGERPRIVDDIRAALSTRYDQAFLSVGANLYRDGRDSVAWHGDRVARTLPRAVIAIV